MKTFDMTADVTNIEISDFTYNPTFNINIVSTTNEALKISNEFQLRIFINSKSTRREEVIKPTTKDNLCYRYRTLKGETGIVQKSIDKNDKQDLILLCGDIFFIVPKTKDEYIVSQIIEIK